METVHVKKKLDINPRKFVLILLALLFLYFLFSGFYTIDPEEVGVIQRFGKYIKTTEPGLHFKFPFGIDELTKVPVKNVMKEEFGFRTLRPGVQTQYSPHQYPLESLMITGDLNIADVEWIVKYRIKNPVYFLFNIRNVRETLRDLSESVMRREIGNRSVDEVIVLDRKEIADSVTVKLQEELDKYNSGVHVEMVKLQNVNPPEKVQHAFNDVNSAKQEREKIINQAWEKYNKIIPEARGKAKQLIEEAKGYAIDRVNRANGDASRFVNMYNQYKFAKTVTKKRIYIETMQKVLPKVEKIYIVDDKQKNFLPLLNLQNGGK
jgi:membrane protease subunit HflK